MWADPVRGSVPYGPYLQVKPGYPETLLDFGQGLARGADLVAADGIGGEAGANDVDAVEHRLGGDLASVQRLIFPLSRRDPRSRIAGRLLRFGMDSTQRAMAEDLHGVTNFAAIYSLGGATSIDRATLHGTLKSGTCSAPGAKT